MIEAQSIALATATLRRLLIDGIPRQDAQLAQVDVTSLPPDKVNANVDRATLNVFLYRVATPSVLRNSVPSRVGTADDVDSPNEVELHYLLTAYGRVDQEAGDLSHRVLGAAMRVLQERAVVNTRDLDAMLPLHSGLTASHSLTMMPVETTMHEMATLWSMFHTSYRLSTVYEVLVRAAEGTPVSSDQRNIPPETDSTRVNPAASS